MKRILITSGGTSERLDAVRVLTNTSTGRTGAFLADFFASRGYAVTLLRAAHAELPTHQNITIDSFTTTQELGESLRHHLSTTRFDGAIHAAAVSDFRVESLHIGGTAYPPDSRIKLPSADAMEIRLISNPKLINTLKGWSQNPDVTLIGFKLTQGADDSDAQAKARKVLHASRADYVVHNDMTRLTAKTHPFTVYGRDAAIASGNSKHDLAEVLFDLMETPHAARA